MKKMILTLALSLLVAIGVNAQNVKGDWYVGTGDIANLSWTEWSVSPSMGYAVSDKLMVGLNVSQTDSSSDLELDLHARYFMTLGGHDLFLYGSAPNLDTDNLSLGLGKMFTLHKGVFVDPKIVYNVGEKTTNMMLGFGLKF
jgi:hypothetical protein|tara:strand:+ start:377 stop:802 length:426 start_codon:yes stop_codon:yes gene_type:complete